MGDEREDDKARDGRDIPLLAEGAIGVASDAALHDGSGGRLRSARPEVEEDGLEPRVCEERDDLGEVDLFFFAAALASSAATVAAMVDGVSCSQAVMESEVDMEDRS